MATAPRAKASSSTDTNWWQQPVIIMGHQYTGDIPKESDIRTLTRLVRWKRSLGFDTEHLLLNRSMLLGQEGGDDPKAYLFRNRHGYIEDYLAKYLPVAHEHGLRVIIYFNCHWFRTSGFPADWFLVEAAGKLAQLYGSGGGTCALGPFRQWSKELAEDLGRYSIDGVFLDGPNQSRCFCPACREAFHAQYGRDLPASVSDCPADLLDAYSAFPADGAIGYVRAFAEGLALTNPSAALYVNDQAQGGDGRVMSATADITHFVGAEGGFVGYSPLGDRCPFSAGMAAKVLECRARGRGRVIFSDFAYKCFDYHAHPKGEIARMYAGTIANGANPWFLLVRAAENTEGVQTAIRFNRLIDENRPSLAGSASLAEAALLHSPLNHRLAAYAKAPDRDDVGRRDTASGRLTVSRHDGEFHGLYATLAQSAYPFDVVEEANLAGDGWPGRRKLIILPGISAMGEETAERLRAFVAAGGTLLATFDTSLFDETGRRRADFALADVFGASVAGDLNGPSRLDYLAVTARSKWTRRLTQQTLPCPEYWWYIRVKGTATPLLHYYEKMPRRYALLPAVSEYPAVVLNSYGRGKAVLIPSAIGDHYLNWSFPDNRILLADVCRLLAPPAVTVDGGDGFIETSIRQGGDRSVLLHLTNWASGPRPATAAIPLGPLQVHVRLPRGMAPESVRCCLAERDLAFTCSRDRISFSIDRLEEYEMVEIS
jgi:hypothetical protein